MKFVSSAPAKIILSGEHSVVHGYPALAGALSLRLSVITSLKISKQSTPTTAQEALTLLDGKVSSQIPQGSGLGSSAAFCSAIAGAWLHSQSENRTVDDISTLAFQWEQQFHAKSSGIDTTTSTFGGLLWFRRETPQLVLRKSLKLPNEPVFAIVHTGKPQESTAEMVEFVKQQTQETPQNIHSLFHRMEHCTRSLLDELLTGRSELLLEIINENGILLEQLGVVSPTTQLMCEKLRGEGFGCKISGAGGKTTHSGVVLVYTPDQERYNLLNTLKLTWDKVSFSTNGVELKEKA